MFHPASRSVGDHEGIKGNLVRIDLFEYVKIRLHYRGCLCGKIVNHIGIERIYTAFGIEEFLLKRCRAAVLFISSDAGQNLVVKTLYSHRNPLDPDLGKHNENLFVQPVRVGFGRDLFRGKQPLNKVDYVDEFLQEDGGGSTADIHPGKSEPELVIHHKFFLQRREILSG